MGGGARMVLAGECNSEIENTMTPDAAAIASRLTKAKRTSSGWIACCPAHDDSTPSLSISDGNKGPVFRCHAGCTQDAVVNAIEALGVAIRKTGTNGRAHHDTDGPLVEELLTVETLAAAKGLEVSHLNGCGVASTDRGVSFRYEDRAGVAVGAKFRRHLGGGASGRGFSWDRGSKPCLYGLWRLERDYANDGRVILCEGETDALTLWQHGYTALALPGASMWKDEWCAEIPEGAKVYVILEPDQGGRTVEAAIEGSPLRDRAYFIRMDAAVKDPNGLHLRAQDFTAQFDKLIQSAEPVVKPKERRIVLRHISEIIANRTPTKWLLRDILEEKVIALMVGARGSLKSFVALDWLMRIAIEGRGAVALSAEGSGLGRRLEAWMKTFASAVDPKGLPLVAAERSFSLCVPDVMAELKQAIGEQPWRPEVILVDTLSKYSAGLDENENSEVRDFLEALSDHLRNAYGCTILLVAHTGYAASDRIRGASSFGANTEAEYIVNRVSPTDMACKVSRERFKDAPPLDPLGYRAEVVNLGWQDDIGREVTSLVMKGAEVPVEKVRAGGANQTAAMIALREWAASHPGATVIPHDELAALLKRQGIDRKRRPEILNWLTNAGAILPSVGGHKVNREAIV